MAGGENGDGETGGWGGSRGGVGGSDGGGAGSGGGGAHCEPVHGNAEGGRRTKLVRPTQPLVGARGVPE